MRKLIEYKRVMLYLVCALCLLCVSSCQERIDIKTGTEGAYLSIYGYIGNDPGRPSCVNIHRTAGYFETLPPDAILGASVSVRVGDKGTLLTEENPDVPGRYDVKYYAVDDARDESFSFDDFLGEELVLEIAVDVDGDGTEERFEARSIVPAENIDMTKIELENKIMMGQKFVQVNTYATLPKVNGDDDFIYRINIYNNNKLITNRLGDYVLIRGSDLGKDVLDGDVCAMMHQLEEPDGEEQEKWILSEGDEIRLRIDVLPYEYGEFLEKAETEASGSVPMFSGPPANVPTNIRQVQGTTIKVFGFFSGFVGDSSTDIYQDI